MEKIKNEEWEKLCIEMFKTHTDYVFKTERLMRAARDVSAWWPPSEISGEDGFAKDIRVLHDALKAFDSDE